MAWVWIRRASLAYIFTAVACANGEPQPEATPDNAVGDTLQSSTPALTVNGFGGVRIGMARVDVARVLNSDIAAPESPECAYVDPEALPDGLLLMFVQDTLVRVDVRGGDLATEAGVRIGSTDSEVRAAYPAVEEQPHKYTGGKYLVTGGAASTHHFVFETDGEVVTTFRAGRMPEVQWVEGCS